MTQWTELADGVHAIRYETDDLTVVVIEGSDGVTVVDSTGSPHQAERLIADIGRVTSGPVGAVINTHAHYDHTFGNQVFAQLPGVKLWGHHRILQHFTEYERPRLTAQQAEPSREPDKQWDEVELTAPTELVTDDLSVDLCGRRLELIPLAPGHTDTDLAIHVPDAGLWVVGDVIEQSGPPMYGSGCFPLSWPDALSRLAGRIGPSDLVVPGHGDPVDREFLLQQASELATVTEAIMRGFDLGLDVEAGVGAARVDWPRFLLVTAFENGYAHLRTGP